MVYTHSGFISCQNLIAMEDNVTQYEKVSIAGNKLFESVYVLVKV